MGTARRPVCIYLLAGLFFAYVYGMGYGDLTSQLGIGRMHSISEALLGQLYLVSMV